MSSPSCKAVVVPCEYCCHLLELGDKNTTCTICGYLNITNVTTRLTLGLTAFLVDLSKLMLIQKLINPEKYSQQKMIEYQESTGKRIVRMQMEAFHRLDLDKAIIPYSFEYNLDLFTALHFLIVKSLYKDDPIISLFEDFFSKRDCLVLIRKEFQLYEEVVRSNLSGSIGQIYKSKLNHLDEKWKRSSRSLYILLESINQKIAMLLDKITPSNQFFSNLPGEFLQHPKEDNTIDSIKLLQNAYKSIATLIN
jgi:hypothetical protein